MDPKERAERIIQHFKDTRAEPVTPEQQEIAKKIIRKYKAIQQERLPSEIDCTRGDLFGRYMRGFYEACSILGYESVSKHLIEIEKTIVRKFNDLQQSTEIDCTGFRLFAEYMHGFVMAGRTLGFEESNLFIEEAFILKGGMEFSPIVDKAPLNQLKGQGLDDETIKNRLLDIDLGILRTLYDITDE